MLNLHFRVYNPLPFTTNNPTKKEWKWVIINYKAFKVSYEKMPISLALFDLDVDTLFWGNSWTGVSTSLTILPYKFHFEFSDTRTWDLLNKKWVSK